MRGYGGSDEFSISMFDGIMGGDNVKNTWLSKYGATYEINKIGISAGSPAGWSRQFNWTWIND
ncbi:hypothetical protein HZR84_14355 [Hyphobacterium sp. CCMP332]|nr:hypothetical protein HZR84_14355 [Hyphobacterium sp. CCMP332]